MAIKWPKLGEWCVVDWEDAMHHSEPPRDGHYEILLTESAGLVVQLDAALIAVAQSRTAAGKADHDHEHTDVIPRDWVKRIRITPE